MVLLFIVNFNLARQANCLLYSKAALGLQCLLKCPKQSTRPLVSDDSDPNLYLLELMKQDPYKTSTTCILLHITTEKFVQEPYEVKQPNELRN